MKEKVFPLKLGLLYAATFVLDCCVTNHPKLNSSKQQPFVGSQFCRSGVWTQCGWVHCSGSHQEEFNVSARATFTSGGPGEGPTP